MIVVADDDAATRYIIEQTLTHAGFSVIEAADGNEALKRCRENEVDLLLLDVEMPQLDGYDTCRSLRKSAENPQLPVVMVTSHDDRESIDRAYQVGATDFISKPISWPLLAYRLRYILRNARNLETLGDALDENRALMAALPDNIFVVDDCGIVIEHIRGDAAPGRVDSQALAGQPIAALFPNRQRNRARECIASVLASGEEVAIEFSLDGDSESASAWSECRFVYHDAVRVLAILRDTTERKRAEQRIHKLAYYDSLTGLPNRALFKERTAAMLDAKTMNIAVFAIDLDRFNRINDTLGSDVGDAALVETSRRLTATVGELKNQSAATTAEFLSCLACFGGNTFGLMLAGDLDSVDLAAIADRLGRGIAEPMTVSGHEFVVTASIGVARSPMHGLSVESLLKNAEAARSEAKNRGNNAQQIYRSSMNANIGDCLNLENDLRRAIEANELEVVYQPKFATGSGELVGTEALLRWRHSERGLISPAVFVSIAEDAGLISALSEWTINRICQQIAAWQYTGIDSVPVAVNLSGQEFVRGDPVRCIQNAVQRAGIEPADLELEITETVLMSDIRSVVSSLHRLREAGYSLAVDDFGTGFSSLRYLQRFPIDVLKIDGSFVRDVETNADSRAICTTIIALARSLNLSVVGEGVENLWQQSFLEREGCDVLQGFFLSQPLAACTFEMLMRKQFSRTAKNAKSSLSLVTSA